MFGLPRVLDDNLLLVSLNLCCVGSAFNGPIVRTTIALIADSSCIIGAHVKDADSFWAFLRWRCLPSGGSLFVSRRYGRSDDHHFLQTLPLPCSFPGQRILDSRGLLATPSFLPD